MHSDEKDSLTKLIRDVESAEEEGCCGYFGRKSCSCTGCPVNDDDEPCDAFVYRDLARRLHALMPHDAEGREIRPGDTIEAAVGTQVHVTDVMALPAIVKDEGACVETFAMPWLLRVVQPDSWERLEHDAAKLVCEYAGAQKSIADADKYTCINCPYDEPGPHTDKGCHERMRLDLVRRAKRLAGVEQ